MADKTISQLDITENVIGTEYLIIDDTERTTRTTINTVTDALSTAIVQSIQSTPNVAPIDIITENYNISANDNGKQFTYTSTNNVTAFITEDINVANFTTTFSQLDYGSVNVKIDSNYITASAIHINDVNYTITKGASINIKRVADNQFLITPVFFSLAH